MGLWRRMANVFRAERVNRELDEEMRAHVEEALERGRDAQEVRRAFGSPLRYREESRDFRVLGWLDALRADAIFGGRQLIKTKATTLAAVLSLALAIGACTAAFRLIDALLLRPLPVAHPERLYDLAKEGVGPDGRRMSVDDWAYPSFELMRDQVKGRAELLAVSRAESADLTFKSDEETEKAYLQYVSGRMFPQLGISPALGRVLTENDDVHPGGHPYAVISYDYWTHRFGQDPSVVGKTFRMGNVLYQIVGVTKEGFTGTEPGTMVDIFLPAMMHPAVTHKDETWHRTLALVAPGTALEPLRQELEANSKAFERERAKGFIGIPKERIEEFLGYHVVLEPAATGVSELQTETKRPLMVLGVLVALVLLITCVNVANLLTAQGAARAREMAVRVSLGGGRGRLIQLVLVQSAWLAVLASALGALFAWWAGPFVVQLINPPDNPARLLLPSDWRVLGFGVALALGVTLLFGLVPALRASAVHPVSTLKGGAAPQGKQRLMHALAAAQVAFCFLVLFLTGLFVKTFERLTHQPTGFSTDRLLVLDTIAKTGQPPEFWEQVVEHLRRVNGVETAAVADAALLGGFSWNNFIGVNGGPSNGVLSYMRGVSPGWLDTMRIQLIEGRDFRPEEKHPSAALVNETFVRTYFDGADPVGKTFDLSYAGSGKVRIAIVGYVKDVRYRNLREPILPQFYVPFRAVFANGEVWKRNRAVLLVRTASADPLVMAPVLRQEVPRARPEFRVSRVRTQLEINQSHTVRERLLATLAAFFAGVAAVLSGVGLFGVLHYSVLQRRKEIGIRIAVGAPGKRIARLVTRATFTVVFSGAMAGLALGMLTARFLESLFYQVKASDWGMIAWPTGALLATALLAAIPPVLRAVRVDPVETLRAD